MTRSVLNFFAHVKDTIFIDTFLISVLTAVLLRALVEATLGIKRGIKQFLLSRPGSKLTAPMSALLLLFLSKFVILEIVNFAFGDNVEFSSVVAIWVVIVVLIAADFLLQKVLQRVGVQGLAKYV